MTECPLSEQMISHLPPWRPNLGLRTSQKFREVWLLNFRKDQYYGRLALVAHRVKCILER